MKILYVAYKFDYGIPENGYSFEHWNFYSSLVAMHHEVTYLDVGTQLNQRGKTGLQRLLLTEVERVRPDLVFFFLYQDEFDQSVVRGLTDRGVPTFNWFADDHWRFDSFSSRWAPCFTLVSTTAASAVPKYEQLGLKVHKTQWAANTDLYLPHGRPCAHDVTFVGQVYGDRQEVVNGLRAAGVAVETFGTGWAVSPWARKVASKRGIRGLGGGRYLKSRGGRTRVDQDSMIEVFEASRINLNLTDASQGGEPQIKGRTFEVPACGGFLLTEPAEELDRYYRPDAEIAVLQDPAQLLVMVRYYLAHTQERKEIARAGYERTRAEHTYRQRLGAIFLELGLPSSGAA